MDLGLADKTALVAGASRGIGLAVARALLAEGATVVITGRDEGALDSARRELAANHDERVQAVAAEMSDTEAIGRTLGAIARLDILVANYGATDTAPGYDTTDAEWDRLMQANLTGPARLARQGAAKMAAAGGGVILFVGSIAGREAIGAPVAYATGKAGLRAVVKTMARELGPKGVRVNLLSPGNVLFAGGRWEAKRDADPDAVDAMIEAKVPLGRFATPDEIAATAAFLCSERAAFMTGADVVVDGGQTVTI